MAALDYFYPRMVPGGFLIVHDYGSLHWNGAEQAVDAFFADKPESVVPLPDQAGSVVVRKAGRRAPPPAAMRPGAPQAHRVPPLALIGADWRETAHGALTGALGRGWSEPEPWGIWGVGEVHKLLLHLPAPPEGDIELDAEVHAALIGPRTSQLVDVCVNGQQVATWNFTLKDNREVRSVRIPSEVARAACAVATASLVTVEFRAYAVEAPREIAPDNAEARMLGVAFHRVRVKMV